MQPREDVFKRKKRRRKEKNPGQGAVAVAADRCTVSPAVGRKTDRLSVIHKNREKVYKSTQKYYSPIIFFFIINKKNMKTENFISESEHLVRELVLRLT